MPFINASTPDPLLAKLTGNKLGSFLPFEGSGTQVGQGSLDLGSLVKSQQAQPGSAVYTYQQMMARNPGAAQQMALQMPQFQTVRPGQ